VAFTNASMELNRKWRERSCGFHYHLNGMLEVERGKSMNFPRSLMECRVERDILWLGPIPQWNVGW